MQQVIIGSLVAFFISFYAIPVIIHIANAKQLVDIPNERKVHASPVPLLGGVGVFIGFILSLVISISFNVASAESASYIAAFLIVFFLGLGDDIMILSPAKKFVGQFVASFILIFKGHLLITDLHGFLGIHTLNETASYILTYFTLIGVINAFNLIDGVDGLAASLGIISMAVFGTWFLINNDIFFALMAFTLTGSFCAFLIFNFHPAKIFMGDAGSMLLGLANGILVIHFIQEAPSAETLATTASPAVGFGVLLIPLMDTLRVFCLRISQGRSPFSPDRKHIHHLLLDKGFSHRSTTITIACVSLVFSVFSFAVDTWDSTWIVLTQAGLFFIAIYLLHIFEPSVHLRVVQNENGIIIQENKVPRLVSFFSKKERTTAGDNN